MFVFLFKEIVKYLQLSARQMQRRHLHYANNGEMLSYLFHTTEPPGCKIGFCIDLHFIFQIQLATITMLHKCKGPNAPLFLLFALVAVFIAFNLYHFHNLEKQQGDWNCFLANFFLKLQSFPPLYKMSGEIWKATVSTVPFSGHLQCTSIIGVMDTMGQNWTRSNGQQWVINATMKV